MRMRCGMASMAGFTTLTTSDACVDLYLTLLPSRGASAVARGAPDWRVGRAVLRPRGRVRRRHLVWGWWSCSQVCRWGLTFPWPRVAKPSTKRLPGELSTPPALLGPCSSADVHECDLAGISLLVHRQRARVRDTNLQDSDHKSSSFVPEIHELDPVIDPDAAPPADQALSDS